MPGRLQTLSADPLLRNFAIQAVQKSARRVADFIMPTLEVPSISGHYKDYSVPNQFKRPSTLYKPGTGATKVGFEVTDPRYDLRPRALDFPIPGLEKMELNEVRNHVMFGMTTLAGIAELDREVEVINKALSDAGAGDDHNLSSSAVDPVKLINEKLIRVIKAAKNGATPAVVIGVTAWLEISHNPNVRGRLGDKKTVKSVELEEFSKMLFGNPEVQLSLMVEDKAPEGVDEDIQFVLDTAVIPFARAAVPSVFDTGYGKTFRLMGMWMRPGSYNQEDERGEVLKLDWVGEPTATNSAAIERINHVAA